ncbi:MAG: hypothetical protein IJ961_00310 [Bacteroidales bacterium]|nr:hypothetical protein [Bacteroidales bacterium]
MKKKILIGIIVMVLGCGGLKAQSDGFFTYNETGSRNEGLGAYPSLPIAHGMDGHTQAEAPLGNGLLILGALALGYRKLRIKN